MTIIIVIALALLTGLSYAVLFLLVKFFNRLERPRFVVNKKIKLTLIIASFLIAGFATYFFLFTSPVTNYKTAYIEKEQQGYKVTIKGKRLYMVHDPISVFLRKTYEDSIQYIIPRSEGVINGQELPFKKGYYNYVGDIIIKGNRLKVDLNTDNYDDKTLPPDIWNGTYNLVWRKR